LVLKFIQAQPRKIISFAKVLFFACSALIFKATGAFHEHRTFIVRQPFEKDLHGLDLITFKELNCYEERRLRVTTYDYRSYQ